MSYDDDDDDDDEVSGKHIRERVHHTTELWTR